MSLDEDNEYFGEEPEPSGGNGEEKSNRTFVMAVLGLAGIGALGVLVLALALIGRQNQNGIFQATQQAIYATNTAVAVLSLVTPTAVPTNTPQPTSTSAPTATSKPVPTNTPAPQDAVDTALSDSRFTTLATALKAAGLIDTLKGQGPITILAPTNDAFAKLPSGTLDALLKNPQQLADILKYHVITGTVKAADIAKASSEKTLEGNSVTVGTKDNKPTINGANVTAPDITAGTGVIHGIDTLLVPPGVDLNKIAQAASGTPSSGSAATPIKGTQVAQNVTPVPTRVPPQSATATAAASKNVSGTVGSQVTPTSGTGAVPTTGAGDYAWLLLAIGLVAIVFIARRMRTTQS